MANPTGFQALLSVKVAKISKNRLKYFCTLPLLSALKQVEKSLVNSSFSPYRPKTVNISADELGYKDGYFFRLEDIAGFWNKQRRVLSA